MLDTGAIKVASQAPCGSATLPATKPAARHSDTHAHTHTHISNLRDLLSPKSLGKRESSEHEQEPDEHDAAHAKRACHASAQDDGISLFSPTKIERTFGQLEDAVSPDLSHPSACSTLDAAALQHSARVDGGAEENAGQQHQQKHDGKRQADTVGDVGRGVVSAAGAAQEMDEMPEEEQHAAHAHKAQVKRSALLIDSHLADDDSQNLDPNSHLAQTSHTESLFWSDSTRGAAKTMASHRNSTGASTGAVGGKGDAEEETRSVKGKRSSLPGARTLRLEYLVASLSQARSRSNPPHTPRLPRHPLSLPPLPVLRALRT